MTCHEAKTTSPILHLTYNISVPESIFCLFYNLRWGQLGNICLYPNVFRLSQGHVKPYLGVFTSVRLQTGSPSAPFPSKLFMQELIVLSGFSTFVMESQGLSKATSDVKQYKLQATQFQLARE